ncbi:MAG: hypothetical protein ACREL9_07210 [Gemmatimonadales bacterium]
MTPTWSARLEIPASYKLPLSWLLEAASPPIQYRTYAEVVPEAQRDPGRLEALRAAALAYKPAQAIARKQKNTGLWGGNLLAPGAMGSYGWKETGTVFQYRRLLEHGWSAEHRAIRLADRFFFRLLSRDEDPALLVEFQRPAKTDPGLAHWARLIGREAAAAALARADHAEDPRLRGAAHRIASDISQYLRSGLVEKPFRKLHGKTILDPAGFPPTIFAVETLAFLPAVQRERAGFIERLASYLSRPSSRRAFYIVAGRKLFKPLFELLGDPLGADAKGHVTDIPFAVYWLELMARLGVVRLIPSATRVLARLYSACDDQGVWNPKSLRTRPTASSPLTVHVYPLEGPGRSPAQRQTDVTFRLALIARHLGLPIEIG